MCFCTERPPFRLWTCGLQCAECKDFSVYAGSQVERGNLRNSDSTLEVFAEYMGREDYTLS